MAGLALELPRCVALVSSRTHFPLLGTAGLQSAFCLPSSRISSCTQSDIGGVGFRAMLASD